MSMWVSVLCVSATLPNLLGTLCPPAISSVRVEAQGSGEIIDFNATY